MKRAILVTTSTVVGVAAVLGYKPNSDAAQTLLDITGANNTASTTSTAPDTPAPSEPAPTGEPTATTPAKPKPKATASAKASATPKPSQSTAATTKATATATPSASATPTATPTPTATKAAGATKTITGNAYSAISHGKDFGTVTVVVTLVDGKMTKITASQNPEGRNLPYIDAVRQYLIPAVLKAQQANVGYVSGATGTSEAFVQSLQSALAKA